MKKNFAVILALVLALMSALPSLASDGFYVKDAKGLEITPYNGETQGTTMEKDIDGDQVNDLWYRSANRLEVSVEDTVEGAYYGVILVDGRDLPTVDNTVFYINQLTAEDVTVLFNVFPMLPDETTEMTLYISSNDEDFDLIAIPMGYAMDIEEEYILGDIDGNGIYNSTDALTALQIGAGIYEATEEEKMSADVNGDGIWNSVDALMILQYGAGLITSWN